MKKMFLLACLTALAPLLLTSCGGDSEEGSPAEAVVTPAKPAATALPEVGLFNFEENGKWGYINREGDVVIEPLYSLANDFTDGRAEVEMNGKRFYIDPAGNPVD